MTNFFSTLSIWTSLIFKAFLSTENKRDIVLSGDFYLCNVFWQTDFKILALLYLVDEAELVDRKALCLLQ